LRRRAPAFRSRPPSVCVCLCWRTQECIELHDRIMEAEEKGPEAGAGLVPMSESPSDDDPGGRLVTAEEVYSNAPLATVVDRQHIEGPQAPPLVGPEEGVVLNSNLIVTVMCCPPVP
jgi:hypothetical protein